MCMNPKLKRLKTWKFISNDISFTQISNCWLNEYQIQAHGLVICQIVKNSPICLSLPIRKKRGLIIGSGAPAEMTNAAIYPILPRAVLYQDFTVLYHMTESCFVSLWYICYTVRECMWCSVSLESVSISKPKIGPIFIHFDNWMHLRVKRISKPVWWIKSILQGMLTCAIKQYNI